MIRIRLFGSIRETLNWGSSEITADGIHTVRDVWQAISAEHALDESLYCAVNQNHATLDTSVKAGDEVAFFPPVTGG